MKKKYPKLKKMIQKIIINDFLINSITGVAAFVLLQVAGYLEKGYTFKYFIYGLITLAPFYGFHLLRMGFRLKRLYLTEEEYENAELKLIIEKLKSLTFFPYKTAFILSTIWVVGAIYTSLFSFFIIKMNTYTLFFSVFLLLGVIPFIWLIEYIIIKRLIIKLIKRYIEALPEDYYFEVKGVGKSIVKGWTIAVSYLVFYTIFFMVTANYNLFKHVMNDHFIELGNSTIPSITNDVNSMLYTNLSHEEMDKYLKNLTLIGEANVTVKLDNSDTLLGSGIIEKKNDEDIIIIKRFEEKKYTLYYYFPANYLKSYNSFLKKTIFFFLFLEMIIMVVVVFQIGKEFKNEVKMVLESTSKIANGDLSRGEVVYTQDELGDLYGAIIKAKNNTKEIVTKISNYSKKVSDVIQSVQDASDFLLRVSSHQDEMVNEAIESINYIDDFTEKMRNSTDTLANESETGSTTVTQFAVTITQVKESMHKLLLMSENSSSAIMEMNSSITEISNNINSLEEFGNDMDNTVTNIKELSEEMKLLLQELLSMAEDSFMKSKTSTEGISQVIDIINLSQEVFLKLIEVNNTNFVNIGEISNTINLIEDYMDQTDVLALNAAIIAAQTDMKDKGIGVIADEIKEISEQINNATANINTITIGTITKMKEQEELSNQANNKISTLKTKVNSNFDNSKTLNSILSEEKVKINESLLKIREQDNQTRTLLDKYKLFSNQISSINGAIVEQKKNSDELSEIATDIKDMAEVVSNATREQTAGANQIAASSERINEFANNTRESVERLKESLQKVLYLTSELNTNTLLSNSRAKDLNNVVDTVSSEMKHLKEEIRKFQI